MSIAVHFVHVSKKFRISPSRPRSFLDMWVGRRTRNAEDFWALNDVSFEVQAGETVGLIGPNGTGKSTALKLISRIIEPTSGTVGAHGRVAGLLELGSGFHPDLTGRENIHLNASILGMPRRVLLGRIDAIIDFADIGPFVDVPVRNYSSGMAMRLGFAVSTALDPDILLIDEILAVGDHAFQLKCLDRMDSLRERGVTILFVSHNMDQVRHLCRRVLWLDSGGLRADGDAALVVNQYLDVEMSAIGRRRGVEGVDRWGTHQAEITNVELLDSQDRPTPVFTCSEPFRVRIHYQTSAPVSEPAFGLAIYRNDGLHVNGPNTVMDGVDIPVINGCGVVEYGVERLLLAAGHYELTVAIYNRSSTLAHDHHHRLYRFEVRDLRATREDGIVHIPAHWRHIVGEAD